MKFSSDNNNNNGTRDRSTNRSMHIQTEFAYEVNQLVNLALSVTERVVVCDIFQRNARDI